RPRRPASLRHVRTADDRRDLLLLQADGPSPEERSGAGRALVSSLLGGLPPKFDPRDTSKQAGRAVLAVLAAARLLEVGHDGGEHDQGAEAADNCSDSQDVNRHSLYLV